MESRKTATFWQFLQSFLTRHFPVATQRAPDFWQLARMHKPIGICLLLWPTLWCLWIAGQGAPDPGLVIIFILGTVLMRAAGCCINDFADRKYDRQVKRTRERPLATGRVRPREALYACAILCSLAFVLVLFTNRLTVYMSIGALVLALCYPFMKRYTHMAQMVLGAAFSWGGMMAFTAQTGTLPVYAWLLYVGNVLWTVVYDTEYAMVDRDDDLRLGIKSTAILFAEGDRMVIGILQFMFLMTMWLSAKHFGLGGWFQTGLILAGFMFVYQQVLIYRRKREQCFRAFMHNNKVGMLIFAATVADLYIP